MNERYRETKQPPLSKFQRVRLFSSSQHIRQVLYIRYIFKPKKTPTKSKRSKIKTKRQNGRVGCSARDALYLLHNMHTEYTCYNRISVLTRLWYTLKKKKKQTVDSSVIIMSLVFVRAQLHYFFVIVVGSVGAPHHSLGINHCQLWVC